MWLGRGQRFNGRVPCCVLALHHWLSGREGRHFSHYCSPTASHVKVGQNRYTYSNKDWASSKSMPLIWSKTFSTRQSRMCTNAFQMWAGRSVSRISALQDILSAVPLPADTAPVSGPSGRDGLSDGSEPKRLWQGNSLQIPWQLPHQPPLILPCHTHKKITEWI